MEHDERSPDGVIHWTTALLAALVVLALAAPLISMAAPLFATGKSRAPDYRISDSRRGKAVISAKNVVPGRAGVGAVAIANTGTKPFRRVTLSQSRASNTIGPGLQLQVLDATTRRCLYPVPTRQARRAGRCSTWGTWIGGTRLKSIVVPPRRGATWRAHERHVVQVRWRAGQDVRQGRSARFDLVWRATS